MNIVDNAYVLEHDEDKVWNFGIEDGHREFEFEEEEEERVRRTVDTRLFLFFLSVEEIIFSLHFLFKAIWINK